MKLLFLYAHFFYIGLFAIGGGYATLPFLYQLADKSEWLSREMIWDMLAVSQSVPGPVGVNLAAFTGFQYAGVPGSLVSALALISPSVVIITIIAGVLKAFKESAVVKSVFSGIRPAGAGLLSTAGLGAIMAALYTRGAPHWYRGIRPRETVMFVVLFFLIVRFKKHPVVYIAIAGVTGVVLGL
jgi:chromate transporter